MNDEERKCEIRFARSARAPSRSRPAPVAEPRWTALLLAGERPGGDPLARATGTAYKALIPIAGRSMLAWVTDALLASDRIGRIVILAQDPNRLLTGDTACLANHPRIALAVSEKRIVGSIKAVAGTEIAPWPVLVTTCDHALLTAEMVDVFLDGVRGADLAVGVGERSIVEGRFPMTRRTWLKFSDGHYSGANLFALTSGKTVPALDLWAGVEQDRKSVWKIFARFGPRLLLRALTRSIAFPEAMRRAGLRLGVDARPVILPQPEAPIDVDKLADLELVETIHSNRFRHRPRLASTSTSPHVASR